MPVYHDPASVGEHCNGSPVAAAHSKLLNSVQLYRIAEQSVLEPPVLPNSMSIAGTIAVSGLNMASLRLVVAASNIANALSDGPLPDFASAGNFPAAYTPVRVHQTDSIGGGTSATASAVSPATVPAVDPTAPFADLNGMVASPNVDIATEFIQLLLARYSFAANAQVIRSDAQMSAALFDILA